MFDFLFSEHWMGKPIRFLITISLLLVLNGFLNSLAFEITFFDIFERSMFEIGGVFSFIIEPIVNILIIIFLPFATFIRAGLIGLLIFGFIFDMTDIQKFLVVTIVISNALFIYQIISETPIYSELTIYGWDILRSWRKPLLMEISKMNFIWNHLISIAGLLFPFFTLLVTKIPNKILNVIIQKIRSPVGIRISNFYLNNNSSSLGVQIQRQFPVSLAC